MTEKEFIKKLREKLAILDEKEIDDIVEEYTSHIEMKKKDGKTEEEAIKDFGNIDDLVKEILSAYKINKNYNKDDKFDNFFNNLADKMIAFFKRFAKMMSDQKGEDIIKIIFKIILILIFIWFLRLPWYIVTKIGMVIFETLPVLGVGLAKVWEIGLDLCYLVVAIIILYTAIKRWIFEDNNTYYEKDLKKDNTIKSCKKEKVCEIKIKEEKCKEEKIKVDNKTETKGENNVKNVFSPLLWILKLFTIILSIPFVMFAVGLWIAFGVLVALLFKGIYLISAFAVIIGLILIVSNALGCVYFLVFKGGKR